MTRMEQLYTALEKGKERLRAIAMEHRSFAKDLVESFGEFLGHPRAIQWVPAQIEQPGFEVAQDSHEAMRFEDDGWLRVVCRLWIVDEPFLLRMVVRKDGSSWLVKLHADGKAYRVDSDQAEWSKFHEWLFGEIITWLESFGASPTRIGFHDVGSG